MKFDYGSLPRPLKSSADLLQRWLANRARSYQADVGSTESVTATVTGSGCHPTEMVAVETPLMTNSTTVTPPVATADGKLAYHYNYLSNSWTWTLDPQSEP